MKYRQLGKNGADIPVIGLGAWPIGGGMGNMDDRNCIDTVRTAIDSVLPCSILRRHIAPAKPRWAGHSKTAIASGAFSPPKSVINILARILKTPLKTVCEISMSIA